jgi:hypothetical protein
MSPAANKKRLRPLELVLLAGPSPVGGSRHAPSGR